MSVPPYVFFFKRSRNCLGSTLAWVGALGCSSLAMGQVTSWVGDFDDTDFGNISYWTASIPGQNTITFIGDSEVSEAGRVRLDQNRELGALVLTDGMWLHTQDKRLVVNNLHGAGLVVSGSHVLETQHGNVLVRTSLQVEGTQGLTVNSAETRIIDRGRLFINGGGMTSNGGAISIESKSYLEGVGGGLTTIGAGHTTLNNNGFIIARSWNPNIQKTFVLNGGSFDGDGPDGGTYDLDGSEETGRISVHSGGRLFINGSYTDSFDSQVVISGGGSLDWNAISNETIRFGEAGLAKIDFSYGNLGLNDQDAPGLLRSANNLALGPQTQINSYDNGRIEGADGANGIIGSPGSEIVVHEDSYFSFSNINALFLPGSKIFVNSNATLDFENTLNQASAEVTLAGGTITGENTGKFHNQALNGFIRGYGHFEIPLVNSGYVAADGGLLVVDATGKLTDWDGVGDGGQLLALTGDLMVIDDQDIEFNGNIRVGNNHKIAIRNTRLFAGENSNILLAGGLIEDGGLNGFHRFEGHVDVVEGSTIRGSSRFKDGAEILFQNADLHIDGFGVSDTVSFSSGVSIVGSGDLVLENGLEYSYMNSGLNVGVNVVVNDQTLLLRRAIEEGEFVYDAVKVDGGVENYGARFRFYVSGNVSESYTQLQMEGDLFVRDGVFSVAFVADFGGDVFVPQAGDEFDLLDFKNFINLGHTFDLPGLNGDLAWDTSQFTDLGVLRVVAIPEPRSLVLVGVGVLMLSRRRV